MEKTTNQTVTIKTNEQNPEPIEIIAQGIIDVSIAFEKLHRSRLSKRAILILIHDQAKAISLRDIETILDVVPRLKDIYLKKIVK